MNTNLELKDERISELEKISGAALEISEEYRHLCENCEAPTAKNTYGYLCDAFFKFAIKLRKP